MIRPMTIDDLNAVLPLCVRMYEESTGYESMRFSACRCGEILRGAIRDGFAAVAVIEGKVIGFMVGCAVQPTFSADLQACDFALYVAPEWRGGFSAARLVAAYIVWAKERGCRRITVGVTAGVNNDEAVAFYEGMGFRSCGVQLSMEG